MSEQELEIRTGPDGRPRGQPEVLKLVTILLQMAAGVGVLVLLFAAVAVIRLWNECAFGTRTLKSRMTAAGRRAVDRMCVWRRAFDLFFRGATAGWTSRRAHGSGPPGLIKENDS